MNNLPEDYHKQAEKIYTHQTKIFRSLMIGVTLISIIFIFLNKDKPVFFQWDDLIFYGVALFLVIVIVFFGKIISKTISGDLVGPELNSKFLYSMAIYEGIALISIIFFHIFGNYAYLIVTVVALIMMYSHKPNLDDIERKLEQGKKP